MWRKFLQKIVAFLDPKLEKYRVQKKAEEKYTPKNLKDFIEVLRRTPKSVLNDRDRERIAAVMSFDDRIVHDVMEPKEKMIFVSHKEVLGPLMLDKLYKSGFTNFPVVDQNEKVLGVIHTEALNMLEVRKTDLAEKYLDPNVSYLHETDTLEFAVQEIERTNSYYFLVLDKREMLAGFFTVQMLLDYLIG